MQVEQLQYLNGTWDGPAGLSTAAGLVLAFGALGPSERGTVFDRCRALYPNAPIVGCSTAGEILGCRVFDDSLAVTALRFEHTRVAVASVEIGDGSGSHTAGHALASALPPEDLVYVMVLSDGLNVNGTEMVQGLLGGLPDGVAVTGGLAGDGERMARTWVLANAPERTKVITAVGFYGNRLEVGYGSMGGWDPFGPERLITRSAGNVLYELDGQSALGLYKRYLGPHAEGLPSTALLFPLRVRGEDSSEGVVRTILAVSEDEQSLTFAGDMPQGHYARLMKANFDRLIDGAYGAARISTARADKPAELALLVSCVGRRLILRQRVEEELESVREVIGAGPMTGFYSYGELCPSGRIGCELHNQTMTVTTLAEV